MATPQPGSPLTAIITGKDAAPEFSPDASGLVHIRLPGGFVQSLHRRSCAAVVHGDVLPVITEALETAMQFWEPAEEIADCLLCDITVLCGVHASERAKSERYRDVLKALGGGE
jgi:hypothetical protein